MSYRLLLTGPSDLRMASDVCGDRVLLLLDLPSAFNIMNHAMFLNRFSFKAGTSLVLCLKMCLTNHVLAKPVVPQTSKPRCLA